MVVSSVSVLLLKFHTGARRHHRVVTALARLRETVCFRLQLDCPPSVRFHASGARCLFDAADSNTGAQQVLWHHLRHDETMCAASCNRSRKLSSAPPVRVSLASDLLSDVVEGPNESDHEPRCLVRATGAKLKISAMIASRDYRRFMQSYGNILKVSLDSLKRKEKIKKTIDKLDKKQMKKSGAKAS